MIRKALASETRNNRKSSAWGAHACSVLVAAFCGDELPSKTAAALIITAGKVRECVDALTNTQNACAPRRNWSKQRIRIDVHGRDDVFRQRQLIESFADQAAQTHDCRSAHQDVKTELSL